MSNGSIDVAPVGCRWMNYVTDSPGYKGDCAGEKKKRTEAAVVTTDNTTSVFTYTVPCMHARRVTHHGAC